MARYGAESATFGGVVFKRAKIWGGCFGYWKIQNGPSVFHIDPLHGLIWPRCKGQFSPKFWYQNSPISRGLNWPQKQYRSGLTRFGPIFGAELALFILQCTKNIRRTAFSNNMDLHAAKLRNCIRLWIIVHKVDVPPRDLLTSSCKMPGLWFYSCQRPHPEQPLSLRILGGR